MHYTLYGIVSENTKDNQVLKTSNARKTILQTLKGYTQNNKHNFVGYFILERVRKNEFPYSYDFFDKSGICYKAGIMAASFKEQFWH